MKNFQRFYSVFFIVIIAFALDGCKKQDKKFTLDELPLVIDADDTVKIVKENILLRKISNQHTVVLLVDTDNIEPGPPKLIKSFCSFPDLNPGDPIADYTTDVLAGDQITWIGESMSNPNAIVCIKKVNFRSNNRIYGGPFEGENCKVKGKIKDDAVIGDVETYTIQFRVINNGDTSGTYNLDPKLRVH